MSSIGPNWAGLTKFIGPAGATGQTGPTGATGPTGSSATASNWSLYPALQAVNMGGYNLSNTGNVYASQVITTTVTNPSSTTPMTISSPSNPLLVYSGQTVTVAADQGCNIGAYADVSLLASNGNRGRIQLEANAGYLNGIQGEISLVANGGVVGIDPADYATGGLITLTATTPTATAYTATSAIKFSAASILSYAGPITPLGSLLGYNYIQGSLGVNIVAGGASSVPNTAGTIYMWGLNGTKIQNSLYVDNISNYPGANLNIHPDGTYWVDILRCQKLGMGNNPVIDGGGGTTSFISNFYGISTTANGGLFTGTGGLSTLGSITNGLDTPLYVTQPDINIYAYKTQSALIPVTYVYHSINLNATSNVTMVSSNGGVISMTSASNVNITTPGGSDLYVNSVAFSSYNPSNWANFPALATINASNHNISNLANVYSLGGAMSGISNISNTGLVADAGSGTLTLKSTTGAAELLAPSAAYGSVLIVGGSNLHQIDMPVSSSGSNMKLYSTVGLTLDAATNMANHGISNITNLTSSSGGTISGFSNLSNSGLTMRGSVATTIESGGTIFINPTTFVDFCNATLCNIDKMYVNNVIEYGDLNMDGYSILNVSNITVSNILGNPNLRISGGTLSNVFTGPITTSADSISNSLTAAYTTNAATSIDLSSGTITTLTAKELNVTTAASSTVSSNFSYIGPYGQAWVVPSNCYSFTFTLQGAQGGGAPGYGGLGGLLTGTVLNAQPGTTYSLIIGQQGGSSFSTSPVYNGGGAGGTNGYPGGGMTSLYILNGSTPIPVAFAGGGGGSTRNGAAGGLGGGGVGTAGGRINSGVGGGGGTLSAGGTASGSATVGTLYVGGNGGGSNAGGGGGGLFGGGGGYAPSGSDDGAGGGGSSYYSSAVTSVTDTQGGATAGSGSITIVYTLGDSVKLTTSAQTVTGNFIPGKFLGYSPLPMINDGQRLLFSAGTGSTFSGNYTIQIGGVAWDGSANKWGNLPPGVYNFTAVCTNNTRRSLNMMFNVFGQAAGFGAAANNLDASNAVTMYVYNSGYYLYLNFNNTTIGSGDQFSFQGNLISGQWDGTTGYLY